MDASDTVIVRKDLHFEQIASVCGVDMSQLKAFNPQYKTSVIPGNSYDCVLRLPSEAALKFVDMGDSLYNYRSSELLTKRKTVDVDESELNKQTTTASKSYSSSRRSSSRRSRRSRGKSVTIKSGQTLSEIAEKYGTSVSKLRRLNNIKGSNIRAGKKLKVK